MYKQPFINYVFRYFGYFLMIGFILVIVSGCDEDDNTPISENKQPLTIEKAEIVVNNYVDVNAKLQMARSVNSGILPFDGTNGLTGESFVSGLNQLANAKTFTDSIALDFCGEIDLKQSDGKVIVTLNFGEDGCDQFGNILSGKIIESYSFSNDSLYKSTTFEEFSFNEFTLNGTSESSFALLTIDQDHFKVSWKEDLMVKVGDDTSYALKSTLCSTFDGQNVELEGSSSIINDDENDMYAIRIIAPLVYDLSCIEQGIYAPVNGVEDVVYNGDSIQIDYGDGDCDYLIELTRQGETATVDLSTVYQDINFAFGFWFIGYEEDGNEDDKGCIQLSDEISEDIRTLSNFNKLSVSGIAKVYLAQAEEQIVLIKGPENYLSNISTFVEASTLHVETTDSICIENYYGQEHLVEVFITVPNLSGIELNGLASVEGSSPIQGDSLNISIKGISEVELPVDLNKLTIHAAGASKLYLSGASNAQKLELKGAAYYNGFDLNADLCEINVTGAGKAKVTVNEDLKVTINGAGKVYYKGDPVITSSLGLFGELINAN